jgi:hypothetical protein
MEIRILLSNVNWIHDVTELSTAKVNYFLKQRHDSDISNEKVTLYCYEPRRPLP